MLEKILDLLSIGTKAEQRERERLQRRAQKAAGGHQDNIPVVNPQTEMELFINVISNSAPDIDLTRGPRDLNKLDAYLTSYVRNHDRHPPQTIIRGTIYFIGELLRQYHSELEWDKHHRALSCRALHLPIATPIENRIQGLSETTLRATFDKALNTTTNWKRGEQKEAEYQSIPVKTALTVAAPPPTDTTTGLDAPIPEDLAGLPSAIQEIANPAPSPAPEEPDATAQKKVPKNKAKAPRKRQSRATKASEATDGSNS